MAWRPTDQYGRFTLEGLTTGRVSIRAEHPEYVMVKPADLVLESGHPVADAVVLMKPGQTVTLRVLDNDGFPIPDASVSVYDFDGRLIRDEVCAPDGYAELKGLPRSVRIEVSKEGYVAAAKTHHGKTGAAVDVVMKLGRADKLLRGRVKDARGFGVGGVAIVARAMGRGLLHVLTGVTESDGAFVLEGAGDGGYHVTADGAEKGRAQVLDADYHREIKMVLDLSEGLPGPPLLAPESELGGLGGDLTLGAENLHQADNLGMTAGPGDTDSEAETPIYTQFGEAHDLPVTGPPPGKGGLPITLGGGPGNVTVSGVAIGSRVGGAGLTKGCKILSIDGNKVSGPKEARRALEGPIGSVVMLEVEENGEVFTIVVQRERVRAQ
jgi:hypothetical protein